MSAKLDAENGNAIAQEKQRWKRLVIVAKNLKINNNRNIKIKFRFLTIAAIKHTSNYIHNTLCSIICCCLLFKTNNLV